MSEGTLDMTPNSTLDQPLTRVFTLDWYKLAWIALILVALISRFWDLEPRVISHDESLHTYYSWRLAEGQGFVHTPLMHGPFQFHALAFVYLMFGADDFTSRIPVALFGAAAVALTFLFRRWLGEKGALLAGLFTLISPYMLYYSRYVRNEGLLMPFTLLFVWALLRYFEDRQVSKLYIMVASLSLLLTMKETAYITAMIAMLFVGFIYVRDMFLTPWDSDRLKTLFRTLVIIAFAGIAVTLGVEAMSRPLAGFPNPAEIIDPTQFSLLTEQAQLRLEQIRTGGVYVIAAMVVLLGVAFGMSVYDLRGRLRNFASIDLMIVMLTMVMPHLAPFPVEFIFDKRSTTYALPDGYSIQAVLSGQITLGQLLSADAVVTLIWLAVLGLLAIAIGVTWNWRKWLIIASLFWGIYIPFYTTMFTNGGGFLSGVVGSVGYWIEQHEVQRGSQPWYYYMAVQMPIYEYLPLIGSFLAAWLGIGWLVKWWQDRAALQHFAEENPEAEPEALPEPVALSNEGLPLWREAPALQFIGLWAVIAVVTYSIAGEKMPWLTVHITTPMILLAGAAFGSLFERINWKPLLSWPGLLAALILPVAFLGLVSAIGAWLGPNRPFTGNDLNQLQNSMAFLLGLAGAVGGIAGLVYLARTYLKGNTLTDLSLVMFLGILVLLTTRTAIYASYINYDNQTEFINYASGAPGVKTVMNQLEQLSYQVTDGTGIVVAFDDDVAWPVTWYLRDYYNQAYYGRTPSRATFENALVVIAGNDNWDRVEPILGDRYYSFEYIRMWWPMQEYWNLTGERGRERIYNAWFGPESASWRAALWDIWFWRDYKAYGDLTGVDYTLSRWPVVDRMRFYVRKDIAANIWDLGVGPSVLAEALPEDPYTRHTALGSDLVLGTNGAGDGQFNFARNVAVAPDGMVYVADTFNHRIQVFDVQGQFVRSFGQYGSLETGSAAPGRLNEPWGIAVDLFGNVYVADTWNHRIQKFSPTGEVLGAWGFFGTDPTNFENMWGPRSVAVSPDGERIYVTDTGNKRVLAFSNSGEPLGQIGTGGVLAGELDEPVGLAVDSEGNLYVADTWNRRVQVFTSTGVVLREWTIEGWYGQSLENKPYIAISDSGLVAVSDPERYRVIVFDLLGNYQYSFGDLGTDGFTFTLPVGLGFGPDSTLWVADTGNHRVMRFVLPLIAGPQP